MSLLSFKIDLDRTSDVPLWSQLAQELRRAIASGDLTSDDKLGNEIELARSYGVARQTVRRAIEELVAEGLLVRKRGVGTQLVKNPHITRQLQLSSMFDDLIRDGRNPVTYVLSNELIRTGDDLSAKLAIPRGRLARRIRRLRFADGQPLAILENYVPVDVVDLDHADLSKTSLYGAMRDAGVRIRIAKQRIGARMGTTIECNLLQEPANSPLLTVHRLTNDDTGRPVEWARHTLRPSRYAFDITLVSNG